MSEAEFRALLSWFMVSDPWPSLHIDDHDIIEDFLDKEAESRGYGGWVDAYHRVPRS